MSIKPIFNTQRRTSYDPFSHDTWNPSSHDEYHQFQFESPLGAPHSYTHPPHHRPHHHRSTNESLANAGVEWKESADAYFIKTKLPGMRREDVKVVVEDEKLVKISGHKDMEFEDGHNNWHHFERSIGKFMTAFMLPEDARADQVKSSLENGVLTVIVPKKHAKHHVRPIEIVV